MRILFLFVLTLLSACGQNKHSTQIDVSHSFAALNGGFEGGLFIHGVKADGSDEFSVTLQTGLQAKVSISLGLWNIRVVGWDGGGEVLKGSTYCGEAVFDFQKQGQNLDVPVTQTKCTTSSFTASTSVVSGSIKDLVLSTCGALYNDVGDTNTLVARGYFSPCTNPSPTQYPLAYQKTLGSYKIIYYNFNGSLSPGITSQCQVSQSSSTLKIPTNIPMGVLLYEDTTCQKLDKNLYLKKGFSQAGMTRASSAFDIVTTSDSSHFFVQIPSGASLRGSSPYLTEIPRFQCKDGGVYKECLKVPSVSGMYHVDVNTFTRIKLPVSTPCVNLSSTSDFLFLTCDFFNGSTYLGFRYTSPGTKTLVYGGGNYTVQVGNPGYSDDREISVFQTLKRLLGYHTAGDLNSSLSNEFDEEGDEKLGILKGVVPALGPMELGGLMWDIQCQVSGLTPVVRDYTQNGANFRVTLSGITGTSYANAPAFTAVDSDPLWNAPQMRYNRRFVVKRMVPPSPYETERVIDVSCDNFTNVLPEYSALSAQVRTGRLEEQKKRIVGDKEITYKTLIHWITGTSDQSRFDIYSDKTVRYAVGGTIQTLERSYHRVQKFPDGSEEKNFRVGGMKYEAIRKGSSYEELVKQYEIDAAPSGADMLYSHKRLFEMSKTGGTIGDIFNQKVFKGKMNQVRFNLAPLRPEKKHGHISQSSNGNFVHAYLNEGGDKLKIKWYLAGVHGENADANYVPEIIHTDISADGTKFAVAFYNGTYIGVYSHDGTTLTYGSITVPAITDLNVSIGNDGRYLVSYLSEGDQFLRWNFGDGATIDSQEQFSLNTDGVNHEFQQTKINNKFLLFVNHTKTANSYPYIYQFEMDYGNRSYTPITMASRVSSNSFSELDAYSDNTEVVLSYVFDAQVHNMYKTYPLGTNMGTQYTYNNVYVKTEYDFTKHYRTLSDSAANRTMDYTDVYHDKRFTLTTMGHSVGFLMKPGYLSANRFNTLFINATDWSNL